MVAQWFPNEEIIVSGDSALRRSKHPLSPAAQRSPHQPCASQWSTLRAGASQERKRKGPARKKGDRLPGMKQWADDPDRPWTKLEFDQFGLHTTLEVKTIQALYYKAGKDRLLTIVLTRRPGRETSRSDVLLYEVLIGRRGKSCRPMLVAGPLNAPLRIASSSWAWRTLPIVFPRPSCGPRRWRCSSTLW